MYNLKLRCMYGIRMHTVRQENAQQAEIFLLPYQTKIPVGMMLFGSTNGVLRLGVAIF